jgi:hypothetical protein
MPLVEISRGRIGGEVVKHRAQSLPGLTRSTSLAITSTWLRAK